MLRSGIKFVLCLAWLWCFLVAAAVTAHLPAKGPGHGPTSVSAGRQILPQIPQDPTAAFYAGQRLAASPSTMPLYIKLLNGQHGSRQAAELQFGNNHNTGYGNYPMGAGIQYKPDTISSQGQQAVGLTPAVSASPASASSAVGLASATPAAVVAPEIRPPSPSVTQSVIGGGIPVLYAPPVSASSETAMIPTPITEVPVAASVSAEPKESVVLMETPAEPSVDTPSLQKPMAATVNNINSFQDEALSGTLPPGIFKHLPTMYRLPSFGAQQQEGHYIIIMPGQKTKSVAAGDSNGKMRDVRVYLATGVRLLTPHQHGELGMKVGADALY